MLDVIEAHVQELTAPIWDRVKFIDNLWNAKCQFTPGHAVYADFIIPPGVSTLTAMHIPLPNSHDDYFCILHEFGHLKHDNGHNLVKTLEHEAEAWRWALQNTRIEPNYQTFDLITKALDGHKRAISPERCRFDWCNKCGEVAEVVPGLPYEFPAEEHYFWKMLNGLDTATLSMVR